MRAENFLHRIDNNAWNPFGLENINNSSLDKKDGFNQVGLTVLCN